MKIRTDIFGYFDSPESTIPSHDPGIETICPICGNKLSDKRKTISLFKKGDDKSYFYRVDAECYNKLTDKEKDELDWSLIDNL